MTKWVFAATMGFASGAIVYSVSREPFLPMAVAIIVLSVFYTENQIMERLDRLEEKLVK
jgi:hypothetical protein